MNERKTYEHLIAGKLQALPVPDMADAIWARIETQLDIDMPTDDGSGGGDKPSFPKGGFFAGGISIIIVAVLYFLFSQTNKTSTPATNLPQQNTPVTSQPIANPQTGPPAITNGSNKNTTGTFAAPVTALPPAPAIDSSFTGTLSPALRVPDSVTASPLLPQVAAATPPKSDTLQPGKKTRGVTGITDNDYRIVPKKDSTNN